MNRRQLLKLGGGALGATAALAAGGAAYLLPPRRSEQLEPIDDLARRLFDAFDPEERAVACRDYDDPLRQVHNRGLWCGGLDVRPWTLGGPTRRIVTDLLYAGLSEDGRERVPRQQILRWPGAHILDVLVFGNPHEPPYQILLGGPHLNLRVGGAAREGAAFGGPMVYGDQRGNNQRGLPGNVYRYQMQLAKVLATSLGTSELARVEVDRAPPQTLVEVQGASGSFDGMPVGEMPASSRTIAASLCDSILSTYPPDDVAYARECLAANGGVEGLHFSTYRTDVDGPVHPDQVFRLEGPGAVFYFRGYPHLHAFLNVERDGERPLSVGADLGQNPVLRDGAAVARFFEHVMRERTGVDVAFYPEGSVAGRLRAGNLRVGDLFALESWIDSLDVVEVRGDQLPGELDQRMRADGTLPAPDRVLSVATTGYAARTAFGTPIARAQRGLLREAAVAHVRAHGFPG